MTMGNYNSLPMQRFTYTIHLEPAEEGGYVVTVPALPGCITEGDTYDEAIANAHEAIEGFVEALTKAGQPIPTEPDPKSPMNVVVQIETRAVA
jgi:predicted RNase H-like HicB family nuclease